MEHYADEGIYLNRALIKELLIELFGTGDEYTSHEIYVTLNDVHLERGGTIDDPRRVKARIRSALHALANEGMAENTGRSLWLLHSPEVIHQSEMLSVAINRNRGIVEGLTDFSDMLSVGLSGLGVDGLPDGGAALVESILDEMIENSQTSDGYDPNEKGRLDGYQSIILILKGISLNMPKA